MEEKVKLYELVGELVSDLAYARLVADKHSCMLSEKYQADPYMNGLPIPHFTITQAEVNLPVMITGVETERVNFEKMREDIVNLTKKNANRFLFDIAVAAISEVEKKRGLSPPADQGDWESEKSSISSSLSETEPRKTPTSRAKPERGVLKKYAESCKQIVQKMITNMNEYLDKQNSHTFKKIDLTDALTKNLSQMLADEFDSYADAEKPMCDMEDWGKIYKQFRAVMINEYDQLFKLQSYIIVNPNTGRLNEFASNQFITSIKLVIKEQDMELSVKKGQDSDDDVVRSLTLY